MLKCKNDNIFCHVMPLKNKFEHHSPGSFVSQIFYWLFNGLENLWQPIVTINLKEHNRTTPNLRTTNLTPVHKTTVITRPCWSRTDTKPVNYFSVVNWIVFVRKWWIPLLTGITLISEGCTFDITPSCIVGCIKKYFFLVNSQNYCTMTLWKLKGHKARESIYLSVQRRYEYDCFLKQLPNNKHSRNDIYNYFQCIDTIEISV